MNYFPLTDGGWSSTHMLWMSAYVFRLGGRRKRQNRALWTSLCYPKDGHPASGSIPLFLSWPHWWRRSQDRDSANRGRSKSPIRGLIRAVISNVNNTKQPSGFEVRTTLFTDTGFIRGCTQQIGQSRIVYRREMFHLSTCIHVLPKEREDPSVAII